MKSLTFFILVLMCSSCMTYQYATISSPLKDQQSDKFIAENDTVKIMYDFSGEGGPVKISIYNKLNSPLYIDWNRSALITNSDRKSYQNKNSLLDAELNGSETRWLNSTLQTAAVNGTLHSQELSGFIPPNAWAKEDLVILKSEFFKVPKETTGKEMKQVNGLIVRSYTYSEEQSPLRFRSFITLSTQSDFSKSTYFDHAFWVSEIEQTQSSHKNFAFQPDKFFIKRIK